MISNLRVSPFRPACPEKFQKRCPQFAEFLAWEGGRLWRLINSEPVYRQMAAFSLRGLPAVASITNLLDPILAPIDEKGKSEDEAARLADRLRRAIGSMIREVLEENSFEKTGQLRAVAPEPRRIFVRAEVFKLAPPTLTTESEERFDWDHFVQRTTFDQVRALSPELGNRPLPSMYSPDRRWFLLSSLDIDVPTTSEPALRHFLGEVKASYGHEKLRPNVNHRRLLVQQLDFYEICGLLAQLVDEPEEFADPEMLLEA